MKVKGKEQLCVCNDYKKYFKSVQGLGGHTLFDRYNDLENIVKKRVDEKYRHFLAQPELDGNTIQWFSQPYYEEPKRLSELKGQDRDYYEKVKNETLSHYRNVVEELKAQNKRSEADALGNAIKFVNDDFVYCYDGKTVLGVWGMELRDEVREPLGIAMKNTFEKPRKAKPPVASGKEDEGTKETEPDNSSAENEVENIEAPYNGEPSSNEPSGDEDPLLNVSFNAEENGSLQGTTEYRMRRGERITASMIPDAEASEGYEFVGWNVEPNDHEVENDVVFTAQFRKKAYKVRFFDGGHGTLRGQTVYDKYYEERVLPNEVPQVEPDKGYRFVGWDKKPDDYVVREDTDFIAQYEEEKESWWSRFWGWGSGCLNWLLALLLLGLIGLLLWYLLGRHNFSFCGRDCECNEYVVVPDNPVIPTDPNPDPGPNPKPVQKTCSDDDNTKAGRNTPESFIFDMGQKSGSFVFEYETGCSYPDNIVIYDGENNKGKVIFKYHGTTCGFERKKVSFSNQKIYVEIIPDSDIETIWEIKVHCP